MNQRKVGAVLSYLNIVIIIAGQLLYTPIMLNILGKSEFGVYSLSSSVIAYLGLLNFGLSGSYLKFYSKFKYDNNIAKIKQLNAMYFIVFSLIAVVVCIGGFIISQNIELIIGNKFTANELALAQVLMLIMTVNMAVMMPNNVFTAITIAHEKFVFNKCLELLKNLGNPILSLPVLLLGFGSVGISCVLLVLSIISLVLNIYFCFEKLKIGFCFEKFDFEIFREILNFSFYVFLWMIVDNLNWQIGKIILANFLGSIAVATYTVGMQFMQMFMYFSTAISNVFVPQVYSLANEENAEKKLTDVMIKVGRIQFYIVFFIWSGFVIFGKQFINLWVGNGYENSYIVAVLLMTPITLALMQNIGIEITRAYNKHQLRTLLNLGMAIFNVCISYFLASKYGEIGCAAGTAIATFISTGIIANLYYSKVIHLEMRRFFKEIIKLVPAMLIVFICGIGISFLSTITAWSEFILSGTIFTLIYIIVMYLIAFNTYEKELVQKIISKGCGRFAYRK